MNSWVRAYAPNPAPAIGGESHAYLPRYREHLQLEGFGILDLDSRAVAQDDDAEGRPLPVGLFEEQAVGDDLELVPVADSLRRLPFFRDVELPVFDDAVGTPDEPEPLRAERHVVDSDRLARAQAPQRTPSFRDDHQEATHQPQEEGDAEQLDYHEVTTTRPRATRPTRAATASRRHPTETAERERLSYAAFESWNATP